MNEIKKDTTFTLGEISGFHHAVVETFTLPGGCVAYRSHLQGSRCPKRRLDPWIYWRMHCWKMLRDLTLMKLGTD